MELQQFFHDLHFNIDNLFPTDWEVNWEDAPLPFKLYRDLPSVALSSEVPVKLTSGTARSQPDLLNVGHFLWYVYGLASVNQSAPADPSMDASLSYRRFVPSGGGLYPSELYVYLKLDDLPEGIYHYDAAHHRLIRVREGNYDSFLTKALGHRCTLSHCFGVAFVSTMYWKNFFKYNAFAHRLQGLDAGGLMGQLLESAKRFGFTTAVYFQFLDLAVNHLLGLSRREETVYAVLPLSVEPEDRWFHPDRLDSTPVIADQLSQTLPQVQYEHFVKSHTVLEFPILLKVNEVSRLDSTALFGRIVSSRRGGVAPVRNTKSSLPEVELPAAPPLEYDFEAVCRKRWSPGTDFTWRNMRDQELARLLHAATTSYQYRSDLDGTESNPRERVALAMCLHGFEAIPDGACTYDGTRHSLCQLRPGDHRHRLQQGMSVPTVNLHQVPVCMHIVGSLDHEQTHLGYRGYRIQQMEAGMLMQRVLLSACALGFGGHPLLGYDEADCDELYGLNTVGKTCLIQIPVGAARPCARLEGGLHG